MAGLRSLLQCPCLALSATVTADIFADVKASLQLQDCEVRAYPPDRDNICIEIARRSSLSLERDLSWLMSGLRIKRNAYPKTVIYARSINCVTDVYAWLLENLQQEAYVNNQRMVAMYHAHLSEDMLHSTMADFRKPESTVRVIVSTVAFGVGIEIPDIRQVVHWGRLSSLMTYWQEVGRAGRDGASARAVWYATSAAAGNDAVLKRLYSDTACLRLSILNGFVIADMDVSRLQQLESRQPCRQQCHQCVCSLCVCCSYCRQRCPCNA